jgi:hypothetical protein
METCEIYITGVVYRDQSWLDNPDYFIGQVYDNLNEVKDFHFASLSLNMSQVYNVALKQTNYESMTMFLKHAKYKHEEFLTFTEVQDLTEKIKKQLNFVTGFSFVGLEVRSSKECSDKELGLFPPVRRVSQ